MSLEYPDYGSREDRKLYEELFYGNRDKILSEKEKRFVNWMYHAEEYASGLDGDEYDN